VASWLVCLTLERALEGWSPGRGHYFVFLDKALYSHDASLHPDV